MWLRPFAVAVAFVVDTGCAPQAEDVQNTGDVERVESQPLDSVTAEVAVYALAPDITFEEVEDAMAVGMDWWDLHDSGYIVLDSWEVHTLDGVPVESGSHQAGNVPPPSGFLAASGTATVRAGQTMDIRIGASSGFTYIFAVGAVRAGTTTAIGDNYAKADFYRKTGSWDWRSNDYVHSGNMAGDVTCGSSCTDVRLKVTNLASQNSHYYSYSITGA